MTNKCLAAWFAAAVLIGAAVAVVHGLLTRADEINRAAPEGRS